MTNLRDVMRWAEDTGFVSVFGLQEAFGIDAVKACRVLKVCWDRGLLMPVDKAFFAPPVDGRPFRMTEDSRGEARKRRLQWYRPELALVQAYFEQDPEGSLTVQEAMRNFDLEMNRARNALNLLTDEGVLIRREATSGGVFGRRPFIYALSPNGIVKGDEQVKVETLKRKAERKGRKAVEAEDFVADDEPKRRQLEAKLKAQRELEEKERVASIKRRWEY